MKENKRIQVLFKDLISTPIQPFPKSGYRLEATVEKGVYLIIRGRKILHVGSTPRAKKGILQRLCNHLRGQSSFTKKYLKGEGEVLRNGCCFKYIPVKNDRIRMLLESYAVGMLCPEHIGEGQYSQKKKR